MVKQKDFFYEVTKNVLLNPILDCWLIFDESNSNFTLSSINGSQDVFFLKLSQPAIVSVNSNHLGDGSNFIFPNPTSGLINIQGSDLIDNIKLYDLLGNSVRIENINSNNQLDISSLCNGVYFLYNGNKNHKIVKQ